MDIQGPVIVTYVYQLVEGEVSQLVLHFFASGHQPLGQLPVLDLTRLLL